MGIILRLCRGYIRVAMQWGYIGVVLGLYKDN